MRLHQKLLSGLAAAAAFMLPGDFSATKPAAPTVQNGLEQILNSDWIEETLVQDRFEPLTEADQITLNCLKVHSEQYYEQVDEIIAKEKVASVDKLNLLFCRQVLDPLFVQAYHNNPELKQFFMQKYGENAHMDANVAMQELDNYFKQKGRRIIYLTNSIDCGAVSSCSISEIKKITLLNARIGAARETHLAYSLNKILLDYRARREKEAIRAGESDTKDVFIYYKEYNIILNNLIKLSKTSTNTDIKANLFYALLRKGLQGLTDDNREAYIKEMTKGTQIHEMAHLAYGRIYGFPQFDNDEGPKESEVFALLTELKNKNHASMYLSLATICAPKGFILEKACNKILGQFFSEMHANQSAYSNISFENFDTRKQNVDVLVPQILNLSVDQIRELAAKSFIQYFPEAGKAYIPQLPEKWK